MNPRVSKRSRVAIASACAVGALVMCARLRGNMPKAGDHSNGRVAATLEEPALVSTTTAAMVGMTALPNADAVVQGVVRDDGGKGFGARLAAVYVAMQPHQRAWNRDELYAKQLRPIIADLRLDDLVGIMTTLPAEDGASRHEAAVARVIGLRVFDILVEDGRFEDAAEVLGKSIAAGTEGDATPKNFALDVEHMVRSYFARRAEQVAMFDDVEMLSGELERIGMPLDRLLHARMSTALSAGVLRGLAMAYFSATGSLDFEKWLAQT